MRSSERSEPKGDERGRLEAVNPPEVEQALRIDRLRREVDAMARRSVWQMIAGIVLAFAAVYLVARVWR
jgi:hypothetical protein